MVLKIDRGWRSKIKGAILSFFGLIVVLSLIEYRTPVHFVAIVPIKKDNMTNPYEARQVIPKFNKAAPRFKSCYFEYLGKKPTQTEGKVELNWEIRSDGTVESAHVSQTDMTDGDFSQCLTREVSHLLFAPTPQGNSFFASHSLRFSHSINRAIHD